MGTRSKRLIAAMTVCMSLGRRPQLIAAILAGFPFYSTFIHRSHPSKLHPPTSLLINLFSKRRGTYWAEPDPGLSNVSHAGRGAQGHKPNIQRCPLDVDRQRHVHGIQNAD